MVIAQPPIEIPKYSRFPRPEDGVLTWVYTHLSGSLYLHNLCSFPCVKYTDIPDDQCNVLKVLAQAQELVSIKVPIWECPYFEAPPDAVDPPITYKRGNVWVWVRDYLQGLEGDHSLCHEPCQVQGTCLLFPQIQDIEESQDIIIPVWECPDFRPPGFVPRGDE